MLKHALTPTIFATILLILTLTTTIPATSPTRPVKRYSIRNEELQIISCMWAADSSYANITAFNFGDSAVSIREVQLDGVTVAEYVLVPDDCVVDIGESVTVQVFGSFLRNVSHQFRVITSSGTGVVFDSIAPEPSSTSLVDSGSKENATDDAGEAGLDDDVPDDDSASSVQDDDFVGGDADHYTDVPRRVVRHVYSGSDPAYFYNHNVQAQQHLADIAATKALLLNDSELEWTPMDIHVAFYVKKTGDYWEAINEDSKGVVFGGSTNVGGVNGSDGGAMLNAAIAAASAAGGGRVTVGSGVLLADSVAPKSFVELCGEGEASVLRQNANANSIFIHPGEKIVHFSMHDLTIDYNHQNQPSTKEGMYIDAPSEYIHFYNLVIRNCKMFGIHLASLNQVSAYPISCRNVRVEDIVFVDVVAENWDLCVVAAHGGSIRNVKIYGMHRNGGIVAFEGSNLLITDCHVTIDRQDGQIVGGIWIGSCNYTLCANNTVIGQTRYGDYETIGIRVNTEYDNIKPRGSYKNMVTNNNVFTIRHGIMLEETMNDYVVFNTLTDCSNGIAFPDYGNPTAIEPKIFFNFLSNVGVHIQEFMTPVDMLEYWN